MIITYFEYRGTYGGGADECVEQRGWMGDSSLCPCSSVYRMDELRVLRMPPRSKLPLLGGVVSSSMLRGYLETECLLEELVYGACRTDIPEPTTQVGTRTDYLVGPWDYLTWAARHLMAWSTRHIGD
jgi:hypothetical protein